MGATFGAKIAECSRELWPSQQIANMLYRADARYAEYVQACRMSGVESLVHLGISELAYANAGGVIVELTPALIDLLLHTDLDASTQVTAGDVHLPLDVPLYIHAPSSDPGLLLAGHDVPLPLDGFYVRRSVVKAQDTGIEEDHAGIEVICISKPASDNPLDDAHFFFPMHWSSTLSGMTLGDMLDRRREAFAGNAEMERHVDLFRPLLNFLLKALIYMNLPDARRVEFKDATELRKRMAALGPKKRARLERQLEHTFDRIEVGPVSLHGDEGAAGGPGDPARSVSAHMRRGHFRRQHFGQGREQTRLVWIRPTFVNARPGDVVTPRSYRVGA